MSHPETDEEYTRLGKSAANFLTEKMESIPILERNALKALAGAHLSGNELYLARECASIVDEGIAIRLFPELFTHEEDKRSLVDVRRLKPIGPGVYEYKGCALFAHRFFRRAQSQVNNLNDRFLSKLFDLVQFDDLEVKVALDPNSIGLPDTYLTPIELNFWWGPGFNNDLTKIQNGVTLHKADERTQLFSGVEAMEFWWHRQDDIQTLEAEELLCRETHGSRFDVTSNKGETYGCRYVHSMIDANTEKPYHLDGSVREYDDESYIARLDAKISEAGKNSRYVKLWRIDGPLEIAKWKDLICHFYRDNHLAGEYLNAEVGELEKGPIVTHDADEQGVSFSPVRGTIAPPVIDDDFGVQVLLSYGPRTMSAPQEDCHIVANSHIVLSDVSRPVIEYSALDFVKLAKGRLTGTVVVPTDIEWIAHEDMDINLPTFALYGPHVISNANAALETLWLTCETYKNSGDRRFLTFTLKIEQSGLTVGLSFAAFGEDIVKSFPSGFPELRASQASIVEWLETVHSLINRDRDDHSLPTRFAGNLIQPGCQFFLNRTSFPFENWGLMLNNDGHCKIAIPRESSYEADKITSGKWHIVPAFAIRMARCSMCSSDYSGCSCQRVRVDVEDGQLVGASITERPAGPTSMSVVDK
ncbi:hypothetical protein HR51_21825 [Burkholderia cepacia]|nr:hypothetical protein HR51_21825 [Burkholderia cepacia]